MKIVRNGMAAGLAAVLGFAGPALANDEPGKQMGTGGQAVPSEDSARTTTGTTSDQSTTGQATPGTADTAATGTASAGADASSQGTGAGTASAREVPKELQEVVQKLHASNQGEQEMGKHAQQMAQSEQVKQYAKKMEQDHKKSDEKLQTLAQTMGVQLTGEAFHKKQEKAQGEMAEIHAKQGAEFDKAYMKHMVEEHEKDVDEVKDAAKKAREEKQTQLASFLDQTHTALKNHLQEAKQIEKSLDRKQSRGGQTTGTGSSDTGATGTGATGTGSTGTGTTGSGTTGGAETTGQSRGDTASPGQPSGGSAQGGGSYGGSGTR